MELVKYKPKEVWKPWADLWNVRDELERIFDDFFGLPATRVITNGWYPAVDLYEEKNSYVVKAELPGVKQEDIKVSLTNNTLTLKGERKESREEKHKGYHHLERCQGEFYRSFQLPAEVDAEKIKATYKEGVLEIEIPKSEKAKPKEISIKVE